MMFQDGALFSSLDVAHNVAVPLLEHTDLAPDAIWPLVRLRIALAGLPPEVGDKMPSELSGGMRKRAAIARALALEPEVIFLDEPTSGLDPITARAFDKLMRFLVDDLGITVFLVTHDLDTLLTVVDRLVVLSQGQGDRRRPGERSHGSRRPVGALLLLGPYNGRDRLGNRRIWNLKSAIRGSGRRSWCC